MDIATLPPQESRLRRVNPLQYEEGAEVENKSETDSSLYYGTTASLNEVARSVEDQKHQLFGICEVIQVQLRGALERIGKIVRWIEGNSGEPRDLLDEYRQKVWPVLVEADMQIKLLSNTVRQTIDACSINERRLDWLLAVHKYQVSIEEMINVLTTRINDDVERVLMLYVRCGKGGIVGLRLKSHTVESIQNMQKEIRLKTFRV